MRHTLSPSLKSTFNVRLLTVPDATPKGLDSEQSLLVSGSGYAVVVCSIKHRGNRQNICFLNPLASLNKAAPHLFPPLLKSLQQRLANMLTELIFRPSLGFQQDFESAAAEQKDDSKFSATCSRELAVSVAFDEAPR